MKFIPSILFKLNSSTKIIFYLGLDLPSFLFLPTKFFRALNFVLIAETLTPKPEEAPHTRSHLVTVQRVLFVLK
jgi:hypothetical protein